MGALGFFVRICGHKCIACFPFKRNEFLVGQRIHIGTQIRRKISQSVPCLLGVLTAKAPYRSQNIKDEVGLDLTEHKRDPAFLKFFFQLM